MTIPFNPNEWIKWKDIERCPYPPFRNHPQFTSWSNADDERLTLIALDRYADYLRASEEERLVLTMRGDKTALQMVHELFDRDK